MKLNAHVITYPIQKKKKKKKKKKNNNNNKVGKLVAGMTITLYQFQQQDLIIPPRVTSINLCGASWKLGIIYYPQANMTGQRNSIRFEENNLLSKEFIPFYINTLLKL